MADQFVSELTEEEAAQYPYLYEMHLHTNSASACAKNTPSEMVKACKEYGYTGIVITEHNWGGNTSVNRLLSWQKFVDRFCRSYEEAKKVGDEIGLQVFFGWEAGYRGTEFLIYGLDKEWLLAHPEIKKASVEEQFRLVHEGGGIVVHAHPYREEFYIPKIRLYPEYVDAVEGINAMHSNTKSNAHNVVQFDISAMAYAREHGFPMTAGSDIHTTKLLGGGIRLKTPVHDIHELTAVILKGEDYILTNGEKYFRAK